jgi:hypothetical protein
MIQLLKISKTNENDGRYIQNINPTQAKQI